MIKIIQEDQVKSIRTQCDKKVFLGYKKMTLKSYVVKNIAIKLSYGCQKI